MKYLLIIICALTACTSPYTCDDALRDYAAASAQELNHARVNVAMVCK